MLWVGENEPLSESRDDYHATTYLFLSVATGPCNAGAKRCGWLSKGWLQRVEFQWFVLG